MSIDPKQLETWVAAVLVTQGVPDGDAALAATILVDADRRGHTTHGVARLESYVSRLASGEVNPTPKVTVSSQAGILRIDGDGGMGQIVATHAMDAAIDQLTNLAFQPFFLRRSGHLGALGSYVRRAADRGKVAVITQVSQPIMAPEGALAPAIGNNPIAFAAPRGDEPPLVVDMSCSRVARGNVLLASRTGASIPNDWAIGRDGKPTTDPAEALLGAMLPMGDHKGLGLAMLVQVLAGSLTGADPQSSGASGAATEVGAFGFVIDPVTVVGQPSFDRNMTGWTDRYLAAVGENGRLPGQGAAANEARTARDGISLPESIRKELHLVGGQAGVPFPFL